jgi:RNA ligase
MLHYGKGKIMHYQFPRIEHINDVLPAIEGREEFIVAERGPVVIINYLVALNDTFPSIETTGGSAKMREEQSRLKALRRECRGIIFDKQTGRILRRPFMKFFNLFQTDETQLNKLDFNLPHKVTTKLDGSFIVPYEDGYKSGNIIFGTKMGRTDVSKPVEEFVINNQNYLEFSKWCISNDISPIFEYTSPTNVIVCRYLTTNLTLLAARHMITGEFLQLPSS